MDKKAKDKRFLFFPFLSMKLLFIYLLDLFDVCVKQCCPAETRTLCCWAVLHKQTNKTNDKAALKMESDKPGTKLLLVSSSCEAGRGSLASLTLHFFSHRIGTLPPHKAVVGNKWHDVPNAGSPGSGTWGGAPNVTSQSCSRPAPLLFSLPPSPWLFQQEQLCNSGQRLIFLGTSFKGW